MSSQIPIPIPDLRFESSFYRALQSKAKSSDAKAAATSTDSAEPIVDTITPGIILQVILKDVVIVPLIQGILWTSVLLVAKPWLLYVAQNGRDYGVRLFKSMGFQQTRRL